MRKADRLHCESHLESLLEQETKSNKMQINGRVNEESKVLTQTVKV